MKHVGLNELKQGDLVIVRWNDASEMRAKVSEHEQSPEVSVKDIGIFLGIGGGKKQHLILGKDVVERFNEWGAARIPLELILDITLVLPRDEVLRALNEIQVLGRRFRQRKYSRVKI